MERQSVLLETPRGVPSVYLPPSLYSTTPNTKTPALSRSLSDLFSVVQKTPSLEDLMTMGDTATRKTFLNASFHDDPSLSSSFSFLPGFNELFPLSSELVGTNNPLIAEQGSAALSREVEAWLDLSVLPSAVSASSNASCVAGTVHVPINSVSAQSAAASSNNLQAQKTVALACGSNTFSFDLPNNYNNASRAVDVMDHKTTVVLGKTHSQLNSNLSASQYGSPMIPPVWGEYYYGGDVPHFGSMQPTLVSQPAPLMDVAINANSHPGQHIQQSTVPPSALGVNSKPNALQIELFHKPKKSAVGWQQMHEGESIRVTHRNGKWMMLKLSLPSMAPHLFDVRNSSTKVTLINLVTGEEVQAGSEVVMELGSKRKLTPANCNLLSSARGPRTSAFKETVELEDIEIKFKLTQCISSLKFHVLLWSSSPLDNSSVSSNDLFFYEGTSVTFTAQNYAKKSVEEPMFHIGSNLQNFFKTLPSIQQRKKKGEEGCMVMFGQPQPVEAPSALPTEQSGQVDLTQVEVSLYHKPKKSMGKWQEVRTGDCIRVTKKTGKWMMLKVKTSCHHKLASMGSITNSVVLADLRSGDEIPVSDILVEGHASTDLELRFKLSESSPSFQFHVSITSCSGADTVVLEGSSVIFAAHNYGKNKSADEHTMFNATQANTSPINNKRRVNLITQASADSSPLSSPLSSPPASSSEGEEENDDTLIKRVRWELAPSY